MKKALGHIAGGVLLLIALAFAAEKSISETITAGSGVKTNTVKAAKMNATGKVIVISDEFIRIERTIRGNVEAMQFALEKPAENIATDDIVKIAYVNQNGRLIATRVVKVDSKKKDTESPSAKHR